MSVGGARMTDRYNQDLDTVKFTPDHSNTQPEQAVTPCVGIIWHSDVTRIGDTAPILFAGSHEAHLSRTEPLFSSKDGVQTAPLLDRHVSRKPLVIRRLGTRTYEITPPASAMSVSVNGRRIESPIKVSLNDLGQDIIIALSGHVVLSLFEGAVERSDRPARFGILGVCAQNQFLWRTIEKVAASDLPVLIQGETGTGKELVAHALHRTSPRARYQMQSVNMATLAPDLAAAELFGVTKGAFTGASNDRAGLFEQAINSTLFLDEIGNTPEAVQPMLLRTLESREYRRVGAEAVRRSNARIVAATDQDLNMPAFSQPLLQRLESVDIRVPPLRERRVDIGLLVLHFFNDLRDLQGPGEKPEIDGIFSGALMEKFALHSWPGNVRELRNAVQKAALGQPIDMLPPATRSDAPTHILGTGETTVSSPKKAPYREAMYVTETEMLAALDRTGWRIKEAAEALGISRPSLYKLMKKFDGVRTIEDLSERDIREQMALFPDDLDAWAKALRVGRDALKRHIRSLRLD